MPLYDLMLLLDPGAPSDRQETILRDVRSLLESDGKLVGAHEWGTRRMTFEIDHRPDAAYHLFQFETAEGGALLERVDHSLKIMDGVLRHRIIRLKDGSPPPPMPRQEGRPYGAEGEASAPEGAPSEAPAGGAAAPAEALAADAPAAAEAPATEAPATETPAAAEPQAPTPAETLPPPDEAADQETDPVGAGGDEEAPSGGSGA